MSVDNWWNDILSGKLKYLEQDLFQCHFVCHKSYMDCPGIEPLESGSQQFRKLCGDGGF